MNTEDFKKKLIGAVQVADPTFNEDTAIGDFPTIKQDAVAAKAEDKLRAFHTLAARNKQADQSTAGQLVGQGSAAFNAINNTVAAANAAGQLGARTVVAPSGLRAYGIEGQVPQEAFDAYEKKAKGLPLSEQEASYLSQQITRPSSGNFGIGGGVIGTAEELIQKAGYLREFTKEVPEYVDFSNTVSHKLSAEFFDQLTANSQQQYARMRKNIAQAKDLGVDEDLAKDIVATVGELAYISGKEVLNNPSAMYQYVAEAIPELVGGAAVRLGEAVAYGVQNYNDGIVAYQEENPGSIPSPEQRAEMSQWAMAGALADYAGESASLGSKGAIKAGRSVLGKIKEYTPLPTKVAEESTKSAFGAALKEGGKLVAKTSGGIVGEGATESFQTYAEGEAKLKPATLEEIHQAGTIGAAVGGAISGSIGSAEAGAKAFSAETSRKERVTRQEQALASGDVSTFTDPTTDNFDPITGAEIAAEYARQDNADPDKVREMQQSLDSAIAHMELFEESKTALPEVERDLAKVEADLAQDPQNAELLADKELLERQISAYRGLAESETNQANINSLEAVKKLRETVETEGGRVLDRQITELINEVHADPSSDKATTAAEKLRVLFHQDPEAFSEDNLRAFDQLLGAGLTPELRARLRTYTDSKARANRDKSLDDISEEVKYGQTDDKGKKVLLGLQDYKERITQGLRTNNQKTVDSHLARLAFFNDSHSGKAQKMAEALSLVQSQGGQYSVVPEKSGDARIPPNWVINDELLSDKAVAQAGGLNIHRNSGDLVARVNREARAITNLYQRLDALNGIQQATPVTETATSQESAQAPEDPQTITDEVTVEQPIESPDPEQRTPGNIPESSVPNPDPDSSEQNPETATDNTSAPESSTASEEADVDLWADEDGSEDTVVESAGTPTLRDHIVAATAPLGNYKDGRANRITEVFTFNQKRPAVATPNILDRISDDSTYLDSLLPGATEAQKSGLQSFVQYADYFGPKIAEEITTPEYAYKDYIRYFSDGQGNIPDALKIAATYAIAQYVNEGFNTPTLLKSKDINKALGRSDEWWVSAEEYAAFDNAGTARPLVVDRLGSMAVSVLGLKARKSSKDKSLPTAELNEDALLRTSLGNHILATMLREGILEQHSISGKFWKDSVDHPFIRFAKSNGKHTTQTKQLHTTFKGVSSTLKDVFLGSEENNRFPTNTPQKVRWKTIPGTTQRIPEDMKEFLQKENDTPYLIRNDLVELLAKLPQEQIVGFIGGNRLNETQHAHKYRKIAAQNQALVQDYDNLMDYMHTRFEAGEEMSQPVYFSHIPWVISRIGIEQSGINPQQSKVTRFLFTQEAWQEDVSLDAKSDSYKAFLVAFAEGFKSADVDKNTDDINVNTAKAILREPAVAEAITALENYFNGGEVDAAAILAGIEYGGSGTHTLLSLSEVAKAKIARNAGKDSFKTAIVREVDAVTSGPILTTVQLGAAASPEALLGAMNKGGFYTKDFDLDSHAQWLQNRDNQDLYKSFAQALFGDLARRNKTLRPAEADALNSTLFLLGGSLETFIDSDGVPTKDARSLVKTPITGFAFGSTVNTAISNMVPEAIENIYSMLEAAAKAPNKDEYLKYLEYQIKAVMYSGMGDRKNYDLLESINFTNADILEFQFSDKQFAAISAGIKKSIGAPVEQAFKQQFGELIETRDMINGLSQTAANQYKTAYDALRKEAIKKRLADGTIRTQKDGSGNQVPAQEITFKEEAAIRKKIERLRPTIHTAFSVDGDNLNEGKLLLKEVKKLNHSPAYRVDSRFASSTSGKKGAGAMKSSSFDFVFQDPGVAATPNYIHSLESRIGKDAHERVKSLNVHDASMAGSTSTVEVAIAQNEATYRNLRDHSLPSQMVKTATRTTKRYSKFVQDNPELGLADTVAESIDRDTRIRLLRADVNRLGALAKVTKVNHYGIEGGTYVVTKEERKLTEQALARAEARLHKALDSRSQWGELGTPKVASDKNLLSVFKNNETTVVELLAKIQPSVKAKGAGARAKQVQGYLAGHLSQYVPQGTKVVLIDKNTQGIPGLPEDKKFREGARTANGWYHIENNTIYLKSPDFKQSGITPDTVLHEVVHLLTTNAINNAKPGSDEALAVASLNGILAKAKDFVKGDADLKKSYGPALASVDELVAWGMTDRGFQQDVLAKIAVSKRETSLVSGLKFFIDTITKLIFRSFNGKATGGTTALSELIVNVSELMHPTEGMQSKKSKPSQQKALFHQDPFATVTEMTTSDVFDALVNSNSVLSPSRRNRLRNILNNIVTSVYGHSGVPTLRAATTTDATTLFTDHIASGRAAISNSALSAGFGFNDQELYVLEQTEAAIQAAAKLSDTTYREALQVFRTARESIKPKDLYPGDWEQASAAERRDAIKKYRYAFGVRKNAAGNNETLSRFMAIALVEPAINKLLDGVSMDNTSQNLRDMSLAHAAGALSMRMLQALHIRRSSTQHSQSGKQALEGLIKELSNIEKTSRLKLLLEPLGAINTATSYADSLINSAREKVKSVIQTGSGDATTVLGKTKQTAAAIATLTLDTDATTSMRVMEKIRTARSTELKGFFSSVLAEGVGETNDNAFLLESLRQARRHEHDKIQVADNMSAKVRATFSDWDSFEAEDKSAITNVLLRSDVQSLLEYMDYPAIESLLSDRKATLGKINELIDSLPEHYRTEFGNAAISLGKFMATGTVTDPALRLNAHNIAYNVGNLSSLHASEEVSQQVEPVIDQIATLVSIVNQPKHVRERFKKVLDAESGRGDSNGVRQIVLLHAQFVKDSLENEFHGSQTTMRKGFTKEILNPRIQHEAVPRTLVADYQALGWELASDNSLRLDSADPDQSQKVLMYQKTGGLLDRTNGVIGLQRQTSKGSRIYSNNLTILNNKQEDIVNRKSRLQTLTVAGNDRTAGYAAIPSFKEDGSISHWRYVMLESTKDEFLERNSQIDAVFSGMAADALNKGNVRERNKQIVKDLKEFYDTDYAENPTFYITPAQSTDPKIKEAYGLIPPQMRKDIADVWGTTPFQMRAEFFELIFGSRKYSVSQEFDRVFLSRSGVKGIVVDLATQVIGPQAGNHLRKVGDVWVELVRMVKDNLVVRSFSTLFGNWVSNATQLYLLGVPPLQIPGLLSEGLRNIIRYQRDQRELSQIELDLSSNITTGSKVAMRRKAAELQDLLDRNPVKPLIDGGLYQTVAEDLGNHQDQYSYSAEFGRRVDKAVGRVVPDIVKTGTKNLFLAQDTTAYEVLSKATQYGDFVARYAYFKSQTERKDAPMTAKAAIAKADSLFVNYDFPTHTGIQYLNDVGIVPFTKYYIRMQKVILEMMQNSPSKAIMLMLFDNYVANIPTVIESNVISKGGLPLAGGAMDYPASLGEIATIKTLTSPL